MTDSNLQVSKQELPRDFLGEIYSFTIVYVGFGHMAERTPYALLMVKIDSSKTMIVHGNIESTDTDSSGMHMGVLFEPDISSIAIGQKVRLVEFNPNVGNVFKID